VSLDLYVERAFRQQNQAFQDIDAVIGNVNAESIAYLSPLTSTQQQILSLLGLDPHIYDDSLPRFQFRKSPKK